MPRYETGGIEVEARRPPPRELSRIYAGGPSALEHESMKALCKAVMTPADFRRVCEQRPRAFVALGALILEEAGGSGEVEQLEEWEVPEGEFADAYVRESDKSRKLFPEEGDRRAQVFPVVVRIAARPSEPRSMLLRMPKDKEVDRVKVFTFEACKGLVDGITLWSSPPVDTIESDCPALYFLLARYALNLAGDWEAERLGE